MSDTETNYNVLSESQLDILLKWRHYIAFDVSKFTTSLIIQGVINWSLYYCSGVSTK